MTYTVTMPVMSFSYWLPTPSETISDRTIFLFAMEATSSCAGCSDSTSQGWRGASRWSTWNWPLAVGHLPRQVSQNSLKTNLLLISFAVLTTTFTSDASNEELADVVDPLWLM